MEINGGISKRLPLIQEADLNGKIVLVRFDHNVVKKGVIKTPSGSTRHSALLLYCGPGGRPVLMTQWGDRR